MVSIFICRYKDVVWGLKSAATRLFVQMFNQAGIKGNIKGPHLWPLLEKSRGDRRISLIMTSSNGNIFRVTGHLCGEFTGHKRPVMRKALSCDDGLMSKVDMALTPKYISHKKARF